MQISVVIPTYNRKLRLLSLLGNLDSSAYPIAEVVIVDSGTDKLTPAEYAVFSNLKIIYLSSESSVCVQRNKGIRAATSPWIFVCDDDIEVPADYLQKLADHIKTHPETGAVSGIVMEQEGGEWKSGYHITSAKELVFKYIFQLSIWGKVVCKQNNVLIRRITAYYLKKGNHISKSGWPVVTDFSGDFFITPVYGLGASLIKKDWLMQSLYDEGLDQYGIGDNYGVAMDLPVIGIPILNNAHVYHHKEPANRLQKPLQYYRRVLALNYFIQTKSKLQHIKKRWLLWSLFGNIVISTLQRDWLMVRSACKTFLHVLWGRNPYYTKPNQSENVNIAIAEL